MRGSLAVSNKDPGNLWPGGGGGCHSFILLADNLLEKSVLIHPGARTAESAEAIPLRCGWHGIVSLCLSVYRDTQTVSLILCRKYYFSAAYKSKVKRDSIHSSMSMFLLFLNEAISHFIWVHSHVFIGVVWLKFDLFRKYKKWPIRKGA